MDYTTMTSRQISHHRTSHLNNTPHCIAFHHIVSMAAIVHHEWAFVTQPFLYKYCTSH